MKLNEAYPSKYLTAEDLDGRDITVTIEDVTLENMGQGQKKENKLMITMVGKKKAFICNKTNANTIAKILGSDDTDDWIGKKIIIGPREVEFQGEMVMSIRVSLKKPTSTQATKPPPEPADQDGVGDELEQDAGF